MHTPYSKMQEMAEEIRIFYGLPFHPGKNFCTRINYRLNRAYASPTCKSRILQGDDMRRARMITSLHITCNSKSWWFSKNMSALNAPMFVVDKL